MTLPGSKSAAARSFVLAALADGPSVLSGVPDARDTRLMRAGLVALGVRVSDLEPSVVRVEPPDRLRAGDVEAGLAGTVLRFLPPLAALALGRSAFAGDAAASARPVFPLLDALGQLGVRVEHPESLPFAVLGDGCVRGSRATLDASGSSQFVSGLLLAGARFEAGLLLRHRGPSIPSRPHIAMTIAMLRARGVDVAERPGDVWQVAAGPIARRDETIETDLTSAATFLAAGMITGGTVEVAWPEVSVQAADELLGALTALGAEVQHARGAVSVTARALRGADLDLHAVSELTPALAACAALAEGPSTIRGVGHIRRHETDRLAALTAGINGLGGRVEETADGLRITPVPLHGGPFATHADHRIAHAGALLGLRVEGVRLDDVACTTKTIADFPALWEGLVGRG